MAPTNAIVGKTIVLEGESHIVAGVLPEFPIFHVLNRRLDIYTPLSLPAAELSREDHSISVYARLRRGVSLAMARSEMEAISQAAGVRRDIRYRGVARLDSGSLRRLRSIVLGCLTADREIGIREAVGAGPSHVAWFVARQALSPALAGPIAGLTGALALHRALASVVVGLERLDYSAIAWSAVALAVATLAALAAPLRKGLRVDPAVSLRSD